MLRAVLDTSILVAALRSRRGASNALLREVAIQHVRPLVTPALFFEYEDVLKRADQRLAHGLALESVDGFLAALASAAEPVEIRFQWRPQLADPGDEMVLEAAVNGMADALVTHNVRDFVPAASRFGLRVVRPGELIKEL
jgi:putative PIN family toxin of toxin-antitoxin system